MTYVGNPIDTTNTFQSLVGKRFDGDGSTTAFTLDVAPSSTLDIEVFVGNVRQDPNSAYTLSGTTLTFTGAPPSGTNNIYVVHQAKSVGTIDPPATISTAQTFSSTLTANGGAVFNEDSADVDFRVESNGNANAIFVNGGEDTVGIGNSNAHSFADNADNLVVGTGSGHNGVTIYSDGSSSGSLFFANGTSGAQVQQGQIVYEQNNSTMILKTAANTAISIDGNGHVTKPLQPAFMANKSASGQTPSASTAVTVVFENEVFDNNADYNTTNSTFTAPVTGRYWFHSRIRADEVGGGTGIYSIRLVASNRTIHNTQVDLSDYLDGTMNRMSFEVSGLLDMDASDTCKVQVFEDSGYEIEDEVEETFFMGYLVC